MFSEVLKESGRVKSELTRLHIFTKELNQKALILVYKEEGY